MCWHSNKASLAIRPATWPRLGDFTGLWTQKLDSESFLQYNDLYTQIFMHNFESSMVYVVYVCLSLLHAKAAQWIKMKFGIEI